MRSKRETKDRAILMGIATGTMPDLELMWWMQRDDRQMECFGRIPGCAKTGCSMQIPCRQFLAFRETSIQDVTYYASNVMPGKTG